MWPFRKRHSLADSGILRGFTDWHSHILPEVDDGVQTMDEALNVLALYERLGVNAVWLTPHIMEEVPNTTARLKERFGELKAAYKGPVRLHLAAEYMLDNLFRERLAAGDLLPLGEKADCLLVETSYYDPPMNLKTMLQDIRSAGYHPVLSHPERYLYTEEGDYAKWRTNWVRFQVNLLSLTGFYGEEVKKRARKIQARGWVDRWGTDLHSLQMLSSFLHLELSDFRKNMCSIRKCKQK